MELVLASENMKLLSAALHEKKLDELQTLASGSADTISVSKIDDRSITVERLTEIPALLRQLADQWEAGNISVNALPAMLMPTGLSQREDEFAVCLVPKSRIDAYQRARQLLATLTSREQRVLEEVVCGKPAKKIAFDMGLSQRTIENHVGSIFRKTMTNRTASLLRIAYASLYW